jgi:hypothetical protein
VKGNGERDTPTGQFTVRMDRVCKCGHTMGSHAAAGPVKLRDCMAHDVDPDVTERCECNGFRRAPPPRQPSRPAFVRAAMVAALLSLGGCAALPPPSPFAECMRIVSAPAIYQNDKLRAADWCAEHAP